MGRVEVDILVSALAGAQLKTLKLSCLSTAYPNDDGVDSLGTLLSSMNIERLETVDIIAYCSATAGGTCEGLANIIRNDLSKLEIINLDGNELNDECVSVLCQSLKHNTSVRTIHLDDNEITDDGWKLFETLVFDESSIESVYLSNHTLKVVYGHPRQALINSQTAYGASGDKKVISYLVLEHLATIGVDCFDIQPFVDYDVEIMPYVLSHFGQREFHTDLKDRRFWSLFFIYELLRLWDIPTLFGFGSAEKARLSAAYSIEINALKVEVEALRAELSKLKTGNTLSDQKQTNGEDEEKQSSKRTRVDT